MENGKYSREQYDGSLRDLPLANPIPKEDHLLEHNVNHQGEVGKKA
jgi:hypothetical protein